MLKTSKQELLSEFGFSQDPFKKVFLESADHKRINGVVAMSVRDRAMIAVIGERGIGKSHAVRKALSKLRDVRIVQPCANDINRLLIGDIEQALILDLSSERPKRCREIRARQLRRILGEASNRAEIVLVIEEAHHLHNMTLRSLKRIREIEWMGKNELLSVVLVGQSDPMNKPGVSEVRLRADSIQMKGLSPAEITSFVSKTVGRVFEAKAVEAICRVPGSYNYEDLKLILFQLMECAVFAGRRTVTASDIHELFGVASEAKEAGRGQKQGKAKSLSDLIKEHENGTSMPEKKAAVA